MRGSEPNIAPWNVAGFDADDFKDSLARIISAVRIDSAGVLTLAGEPFTAGAGSEPLATALQQALYARCFIQSLDDPAPVRSTQITPEGDLTAALSRANAGQDRWDPFWQITQVYPSGHALASKNGWHRQIGPGEYIASAGPGAGPRVGSPATLFLPSQSAAFQPGFHFAFGQTVMDSFDDGDRIIRFYWNIQDVGAPALLTLVTQKLNRFQIPFRFKCLNHRSYFPRLDAALLYVHHRFFHIAVELMLEIRSQLERFVGERVPLFTRMLAPGLALAEDPSGRATPAGGGGGIAESFGTHRCRLMAEGILRSYMDGCQNDAARFAYVSRRFENEGISLDRPYLNAGSPDDYEFSWRVS